LPRKARIKCASGLYHVVIRGNGKQVIFEDDNDRVKFLSILSKVRKELNFGLAAYCLMDNHVHMIIHDVNNELELIMKKIECSYSYHLNSKYTRSGHVFQDRYKSAVIENDSYFMSAIRYIHMNPENAGICSHDTYRWSSHGAYIKNAQNDEVRSALDIMGGVEGYLLYMRKTDDEKHLEISDEGKRFLNDDEARVLAKRALGMSDLSEIKGFDKMIRNEQIKKLKDVGLSDRKIERLTGISRDIVRRA